ncbi:hypothetical protein Tcan_17165 [Toxocara canis]|nr:hypothetical protein Tcan_17165 [Toxocara canis]
MPSAAPPGVSAGVANGYALVEPNPLLHVDTLHTQRGPPRMSNKKQNSAKIPFGDVTAVSSSSPQPASGVAVPLAGKSYRDAASKKQRVVPNSTSLVSANAVTVGSVRHTSSSSSGGTPQLSARKITSSQRTVSERHSSGDSLLEVHHTILNDGNSLDISGKQYSGTDVAGNVKSASVTGRRMTENDFQKITHKKSKGCKGGRSGQVIADEDGLTGNQALDASSRFDILQSLGSQSAAALLQHTALPSSRRSRSSGVSQRDATHTGGKSVKAAFSSGAQQGEQHQIPSKLPFSLEE